MINCFIQLITYYFYSRACMHACSVKLTRGELPCIGKTCPVINLNLLISGISKYVDIYNSEVTLIDWNLLRNFSDFPRAVVR